ncbi:adenine phosphoribosyltransferase [Porphyromonadaceae sp. NP-X]|jgi:adenine phosphoribosyltransferase|nr:adenine phosphoribosyltransferase [Paludibacteraceae bacterium]MBP9016180.1 adenine phosphoribosyltransferase [Paludibacteraceae bacterium]MDS1032348.1 adenine phosphoribosyltransferase [Porphyromonadaceae sp. NP-X]NLJ19643.1 adenine phosphoribosyltransferase [Bacteroidales bacterium]
MDIEQVIASIRNIPDFPKKGVLFKDITTAMKDAEVLRFISDELYEYYKDKGITKVVGLESRGFMLGSILAYKLHAGFVLIRKAGKLPAETYRVDYELEYGVDSLEIHKDAIEKNDIVLLHDDLLATGGSANAALTLLDNFKPKSIYVSFLIELKDLKGRDRLKGVQDVHSLIQF